MNLAVADYTASVPKGTETSQMKGASNPFQQDNRLRHTQQKIIPVSRNIENGAGIWVLRRMGFCEGGQEGTVEVEPS